MRSIGTLICCLALYGAARGEDYELRVSAAERFLPPLRGITIIKAGEPGPGAAKHKPIAAIGSYKESVKLTGAGPYDVWWQSKDGLAVRLTAGLLLKSGETREIKADDYLGVVNVSGDGQPRAGLVTIAPQDDPGPGEKGHIPIQTAKDFRVEMVAPAGFYSLWITPDNGARSRKINDRFRVLAGKTVQLD